MKQRDTFLTGTDLDGEQRLPPPRYNDDSDIKDDVYTRLYKTGRKTLAEWEQDIIETKPRKEKYGYWNIPSLFKMDFKPESDEIYDYLPIQPGVNFFKALVRSNIPYDFLKVNIPDFIIGLETTRAIFYDEKEGRWKKTTDYNYTEFEAKMRANYKPLYEDVYTLVDNKLFKDFPAASQYPGTEEINGQDLPFFVNRNVIGVETVYTWRMLLEHRRYNIDNNQMFQRYIFPKGNQANILRLVFHTKNNRGGQGNYAYRIKNKLKLFEQKGNLLEKATICRDKPKNIEFDLVRGIGLREYESLAENVVAYLEKSYNVRIKVIVLDFMTDLEDVIWLVNMKHIELDKVPLLRMKEKIEEGGEKLDKLTCSVYCKLCGLIFKKDDASKTLTYKLLWELLQHLKKRNLKLQGITISHNSTRPCRVCDLCYMLVVSEHELIEVEQKFARAQNIPIQDPLIRVPIVQKAKRPPGLSSDHLYQWRLMFFFHYVTDFVIDPNDYHEDYDMKNIYLQYKFFNHKSCFKLDFSNPNEDPRTALHSASGSPTDSPRGTKAVNELQKGTLKDPKLFAKTADSKVEIPMATKKKNKFSPGAHQINLIRCHYFFSEDENIDKFLEDTTITLRFTSSPDWNDVIAEGSSQTIRHFRKHYDQAQTHQGQIFGFFKNGKYCSVKFTAGLVRDTKFNIESVNLYKNNGIYLPDEGFYNSNPFPIEWMEIFEKSEKLIQERFERMENPPEQVYAPKCTPHDMEKMIDLVHTKNSISYSHVESKIRRVMSAQTRIQSSKMQAQQTASSIEKEPIEHYRFSLLTESARKNRIRPHTGLPPTGAKGKFESTLGARGSLAQDRPSTRELSRNKSRASDLNERDDGGEHKMEILSYLDKKGGKSTKKKVGQDMDAKALEEFEKDFNALDADEVIKKYLDVDKALKNEETEDNYDEDNRIRGSTENKDFTHDDLQGFIDHQKAKVSAPKQGRQ